jgi:ubiquinone/menaquinone biosynthesis C-methylase UbiE
LRGQSRTHILGGHRDRPPTGEPVSGGRPSGVGAAPSLTDSVDMADSAAPEVILDRALANEADMAFRRRAAALFEFLDLQPGDRVLDAGCGRGFFLNLALAICPSVRATGVELEPGLLRVGRAQLPGIALASARIESLPFADGAFDKVLFTEVLEHIANDRQAVAEVARVLAPGGTLALTTPHANYPFWWDPINKTLEATIGTPIRTGPLAGIWANHVRLYTPEDLVRLVSDAGLAVEEVRFLVHHCFPFIHNLVYGIGKPLLERGVLPDGLATAADRFDLAPAHGSLANPVRLGIRLFRAFDRLDDFDPPTADGTFLLIAIKARRLLGATA